MGASRLQLSGSADCLADLSLNAVYGDRIELVERTRSPCSGTQFIVLFSRGRGSLEYYAGAVTSPQPTTHLVLARQS